MSPRRTVGILLFPDVEPLDFCGPFEVFSVARLDESTRWEAPGPYDVFTVAQSPGPLDAYGGLTLIPRHTFATCPRLDVLVVPGGWGVRAGIDNAELLDWITSRAAQAELTTSVCTGSWLLGRAGLLNGRRSTTHGLRLDWLRQNVPATTVVADEAVVHDGPILTSAGISAGIDLALRVVSLQHGEAIARATADFMEYPYPCSNRRHVPAV